MYKGVNSENCNIVDKLCKFLYKTSVMTKEV